MTFSKRVLIVPTLMCVMGGAALAAPTPASRPVAEPIPTSADARQQFTDGKYADVVKTVSKITISREWQATKAEAYELYTMKGEAHLHLKESALAAAAFELASKAVSDQITIDRVAADKAAAADNKVASDAAEAKITAERSQAGIAHATAYLIKHSIGTNYVPKATANQRVAGGKPDDHIKLDIVDPESRKQALTAIWTDEKNASNAKFTAASDMDNKSMGVVMEAAAAVGPLRDFDFAANGSDDDTHKVSQAIAEHGRDLLQEMLDKMIVRLDVISSDAYSVEQTHHQSPGGSYTSRWHKHGLEGKQPSELQDMLNNAAKVSTALKLLQDELAVEKDFYDKANKDAKRIHDQATKLLKTKYDETFVTKEAAMKS